MAALTRYVNSGVTEGVGMVDVYRSDHNIISLFYNMLPFVREIKCGETKITLRDIIY